jgi:hypothetical protein
MPKQSPATPAASSLAPDPTIDSDRLDAIGRYVNLRDWSFAVVDLMEVAGQSLTSPEPFDIANPTLKGISGLLRDLLQQMDERVDVIRGA